MTKHEEAQVEEQTSTLTRYEDMKQEMEEVLAIFKDNPDTLKNYLILIDGEDGLKISAAEGSINITHMIVQAMIMDSDMEAIITIAVETAKEFKKVQVNPLTELFTNLKKSAEVGGHDIPTADHTLKDCDTCDSKGDCSAEDAIRQLVKESKEDSNA